MSIITSMSVINGLFLLVILKDCSGHEIEGCSPNSTMEVNATANTFKCIGIPPDQNVAWYVRRVDPYDKNIISIANLAVCTMQRKLCRPYMNHVRAYRQDKTTSVLTFFSENIYDFFGIGCRVFTGPHQHGTYTMNDYICNLISKGQEIEGCSPDSPMEVNAATNKFKCVGIKPGQHVAWHVRKVDPRDKSIITLANIAVCTMQRKYCRPYMKNVKANRLSNTTSVLTIFYQDMSDFLSIGCRVFTGSHQHHSEHVHDYICNLISRGVPTFTCTLQKYHDDSTTVICSVLKIYILKRSYQCIFIVTSEDGTETTTSNSTFFMTERSVPPATGTCFYHNLPSAGPIHTVEAVLLPDNLHTIAVLEHH